MSRVDETARAEADASRRYSNATLKVTKLVLPGMISRKRGLILSVGSFASLIPSPLLAVYSGSKAFLSTWSQALGSELKGTGVEVELLNAYFVVSRLVRCWGSWLIPLHRRPPS